ncbi:MAG: hypothetical protein ATN31_04110 [Candidatus Epulonipiscioides saccharophilum]|nr:MAG: hypothetical protein ATN31_04110 [Epulopiscium sp. AS2M-Bin001]
MERRGEGEKKEGGRGAEQGLHGATTGSLEHYHTMTNSYRAPVMTCVQDNLLKSSCYLLNNSFVASTRAWLFFYKSKSGINAFIVSGAWCFLCQLLQCGLQLLHRLVLSQRKREANDLLTRLRLVEKVGYTDFIGLTDLITENQLKKMAWTPIVRHSQIKHTHSPFNKELEEYFTKRNIKEFDKNNVAYRQKLAKKQRYTCSMCGKSITNYKEGLETHHKIPRDKGGTDEYKNLQLVHISCHIEYHRLFPVSL